MMMRKRRRKRRKIYFPWRLRTPHKLGGGKGRGGRRGGAKDIFPGD
jgi:hypothetical protein